MSLARFKTPVATTSREATVEQAACTMRDRGVGCLVITDKGHPTAIVTDRDLVVRVLARGIDPSAPVGRFVTHNPITLSVVDGVETATEQMRLHGVRRMPLVDERGEVVGIVTADDLLILLGGEIGGLGQGIENRSDSSDSC